ncbi:MAG: type II toxin-antitoxin system VapC family toxin [Thermodesulfobacteriota bacterium]
MIVVLDASVFVKWLLQDRERDADTDHATAVVEAVVTGRIAAVQPVHWLAEVGGVIARLSPKTAEEDVALLQALDLPVSDAPAVLRRACRLAIALNHHLFDTLYHAVALEVEDATLVTADRRYLKKARRVGRTIDLVEWQTAVWADGSAGAAFGEDTLARRAAARGQLRARVGRLP